MSHYQGSAYDRYRPNGRSNSSNADNNSGYRFNERPSHNRVASQRHQGAAGQRDGRYSDYRENTSNRHMNSSLNRNYYLNEGHSHGKQETKNMYYQQTPGASYASEQYHSSTKYNNSTPTKSFQGIYQNAKHFQGRQPNNNQHQVYSQIQAENQLWMGDLDPKWTESEIFDIWVKVGEAPSSVKLIKDKTGKPQYCFVTFPNQTLVASALQKNRAPIPGSSRHFKLNWATGSGHGDHKQTNNLRGNLQNTKNSLDFSLFVGDLGIDVTEPVLFAEFNTKYPGAVKQVKIMLDANSGLSKGFGFVRFFNSEAQSKALKEMNGAIIGQRPIRVGLANGSSQDSSSHSGKKNETQPKITLSQYHPAISPFTDPNNTVISIKNVTSGITREELLAHFLPFGHIIYCKINYADNIAHIQYLSRGSAEKAILFMHGMTINESRLVLRWGRQKLTTEGKLRFEPTNKNSPYVAAEKPPAMFGEFDDPIRNVILEDLSKEEIRSLNFIGTTGFMTTDQINEAQKAHKEARQKYLDQAF